MKKTMIISALLFVVVSLLCAPACAEQADDNPNIRIMKQVGNAFTDVARKAIPAVVFITVEKDVYVRGGRGRGYNDPYDFFERLFKERGFESQPRKHSRPGPAGSGFLISKDGYILTNNHVVGDADKITVKLHDGREVEAKRVGADPRSEVALIKIEGTDFSFVELGDSAALEIGEWVIAIGNPFGLTETLTVGVVSAKGRSNIGITDYEDFIQTDAAINPGNSGGPLLNIEGRVVGINTAIFSQSGGYMGIGFAIPINMARAIKDQLMKSGKVVRGYIGITLRDIDEELAEQFELKSAQGILINEVLENSAGEKAGLKHGDIIVKLDGKKVRKSSAFRNTIASEPPGTTFVLSVFRSGRTRKVKVKTTSLPGDTDDPAVHAELFEKLGFALTNLTSALVNRFKYEMGEGVIVSHVAEGGQAVRIGIQPGHLITSVGRKPVPTVKAFVEAVQSTKRHGRILLRIRGERYAQYVTMILE